MILGGGHLTVVVTASSLLPAPAGDCSALASGRNDAREPAEPAPEQSCRRSGDVTVIGRHEVLEMHGLETRNKSTSSRVVYALVPGLSIWFAMTSSKLRHGRPDARP